MGSFISSASACNSTFNKRTRYPLLPPPSALIISRVASGWRCFPIVRHHRRIALTAKLAVSWSVPMLTQPTLFRDVIDAVRNGAAQLGINEIMNIDQLGPVFWAPFATVILEITHQFLLFRINRNDGFIRRQERLRLRIDVLELGVTVPPRICRAARSIRPESFFPPKAACPARLHL